MLEFTITVRGRPAALLNIEGATSSVKVTDRGALLEVLPASVVERSAEQIGFWARYFGRMHGDGSQWATVAPLLAQCGKEPVRGLIGIKCAAPPAAPAFAPLYDPAAEPSDPPWTDKDAHLVSPRERFQLNTHADVLRLAAAETARACGVDCLPIHRPDGRTLQMRRRDTVYDASGPTRTAFVDAVQACTGARSVREENGGPGLGQGLALINEVCAVPAADTLKMLRWVVFSVMAGNTDVHAGHIGFVLTSSGWRLAPFALPAIQPALLGPVDRPEHQGFRIGGEFGSEWLRADHWIRFAQQAGIKPRAVFNLMTELARKAPTGLEQALVRHYQTGALRGAPLQAAKGVRARAQRMGDLAAMAARSGVAGVKVETAAPAEPRISDPIRHYPTSAFDDL